MKATETKFIDFLKNPKQFIIPIYQRTYSWTLWECKQLWNDIVKAGNDDSMSGHFVGSVVYIEKGLYQISTVPQLLVIDGQQRLTTISILLSALGNAIEKSDKTFDITKKKIDNYFLFNAEEEGNLKYKLSLTQTDKETLIRILEGRELPQITSNRVKENYQYFKDQIENSGIDLSTIYKGIAKLIIVDISLDGDHDNPQLIFESLNSTGLELSQADLIRNFILMGQEPKQQEQLYNDYWYTMEKSFGQTSYITHFDRFMRDYLTMKSGKIPKISEVYQAFKIHSLQDDSGSIDDIVSDIYEFSKYFVSMALEKEEVKNLRAIFKDINVLRVDVAYPLLLELYNDYSNKLLSKEELIEVLRYIESYVFRRAICGIPTNSLNKTFATFSKEIDKSAYVESFKAALLLKDSYRRFPDDDEFMRELSIKDLYNFRNRNYWLRRLENNERKEKINIEEYTIEHIMPQNENLSDEWKSDLGENWRAIQKQFLHTIGNLTLTGYNSELSDHPFKKKRNMEGGFANSPLRLNKGLGQLECWNETEITKRAEQLAKHAIEVWKYPDVSEEVLKKYRLEESAKKERTYTLQDHPHLQGDMLVLFDLLRKRILNLDSSVTEEVLKRYIAYKSATNFVDIVPQKNCLRLSFNMKFNEMNDPHGLCRDITGLSRWGNGDVTVKISSPDQLDDIMLFIEQSLEKNMDNGNE